MAVYTPLFDRSVDAVVALLAAGADRNARNNNGETPLHRADSADDVAALLAAGALLNARDTSGRRPWTRPPKTGSAPRMSPQLCWPPGRPKRSGQLRAHASSQPSLFCRLRVQPKDPGFDEIKEEFMARDVEVARVLLAAGADPNARDATGATPLDRMRSVFEELVGGPRPPLYWLLKDVTAR